MQRQPTKAALRAVLSALTLAASLVGVQAAGIEPAAAGCVPKSSQSQVWENCTPDGGSGASGGELQTSVPDRWKPAPGTEGQRRWTFTATVVPDPPCPPSATGVAQNRYRFIQTSNLGAPPGTRPPTAPPDVCQPASITTPPEPTFPAPSRPPEVLLREASKNLLDEVATPVIWTDFTGERFLVNSKATFQALDITGAKVMNPDDLSGLSGQLVLELDGPAGLEWNFGDKFCPPPDNTAFGTKATHTYQSAVTGAGASNEVTVELIARWRVTGYLTDLAGNLFEIDQQVATSNRSKTLVGHETKKLVQVIAARTEHGS